MSAIVDQPTDLSKLLSGKTKFILHSAASDYTVNARGAMRFYDEVVKRHGQAAVDRSVRYYVTPNGEHGSVGHSATTGTALPHYADLMGALRTWVEKDVAPESMVQTLEETTRRTRSCGRGRSAAIPNIHATRAAGNPANAQSYSCAMPQASSPGATRRVGEDEQHEAAPRRAEPRTPVDGAHTPPRMVLPWRPCMMSAVSSRPPVATMVSEWRASSQHGAGFSWETSPPFRSKSPANVRCAVPAATRTATIISAATSPCVRSAISRPGARRRRHGARRSAPPAARVDCRRRTARALSRAEHAAADPVRRGIYVQLVTSAVREIPAAWRGLPRLSIVVSIDGLQPEHDARRTPATYDRILEHIAGHQITVHCTVTRQQIHRPGYLEEFLEFWSRREETTKIWMSLYTPQIGEVSAERLTTADRRRVVADLLALRLKYPKLQAPRELLDVYAEPPRSPDECVFARTTTTISADLTTRITPCQFGGAPDCASILTVPLCLMRPCGILIVVLLQIIGPICYFAFGRGENDEYPSTGAREKEVWFKRSHQGDLNLSVPGHSVFGFLGQNGAGKTTTMKMILGLTKGWPAAPSPSAARTGSLWGRKTGTAIKGAGCAGVLQLHAMIRKS